MAKQPAQEPRTLTAADIVDRIDLRVKAIDVPEWGGKVHIKAWSGREFGIFSEKVEAKGDGSVQTFPAETVALTVALSLCDADGNRLFPDHKIGVERLLEKNSNTVQRIFSEALRHNSQIAETTEAEAESAGND